MTTITFTNDYTADDWITENNESFRQIEREFDMEFTYEDKNDIAHMVAEGESWDNAIYHWFND